MMPISPITGSSITATVLSVVAALIASIVVERHVDEAVGQRLEGIRVLGLAAGGHRRQGAAVERPDRA